MSFIPDQKVVTCTVVNLRATPGHRGKPLEDVLGLMAMGTSCRISGDCVEADDLTWWPVHAALESGAAADGWAAEAVDGTTVLAAAPGTEVDDAAAEVDDAPSAEDAPSTDGVPSGGDLPPAEGMPSIHDVPSGGDIAPAGPPVNKLGFYLHSTDNEHGLWDGISRVQPPVLLIHEDAANDMLLNEIRDFRAPEALIVGRYYVTNDAQRAMLESGDPEAEGRRFAERILEHDFGKFRKRAANGRLFFDAWMSLNESIPGPASGTYADDPHAMHRLYDSYDRFQAAFRRRLVDEGIEAVAFNFAAGNFVEPEHYLDHFPRTLESYVYLGFHEYGWPSLIPGAGVATGAGVYRNVLEAVRAKYGTRHRVIITEAGLTRAYGHPQSPDEGWLNDPETLDEEAYWRSLAWYNALLDRDDYALGACLYQVGHRGDWATFRHIGRDNQGRDLHLIDRIVALKDAAGSRGVAARTAAAAPSDRRLKLECVVTADGRPVRGAEVRLVGGDDTLGGVRRAALNSRDAVSWSSAVSGYEGSLRGAWYRFVAPLVAGLTWDEYRRNVVVQNPSLVDTQFQMQADREYTFPENPKTPEIVWDRLVTGYSGPIGQAWLDMVRHKVIGLTHSSFRTGVLEHNPELARKDGRFHAEDTYVFPRNTGQTEYALTATTNARGRARLSDLPEGAYRLEVNAAGLPPRSGEFALHADREILVEMRPVDRRA